MNVLFLGENVGKCGTTALVTGLKPLINECSVDFTILNGEGTSKGYGLNPDHVRLLYKAGVDVITLGEKTFYKSDMVDGIDKFHKILRPANYPEGVPGSGIGYYQTGQSKVCVINMLGMMGFQFVHLNNPFLISESIVLKALEQTPLVFFIFHAQATAEKKSMGYFLSGKASCVIGTHTKVMTADACITDGGTAYITDNGRCGAFLSVGGFEPQNEIYKYHTGVPVRSNDCSSSPQIQGLLVTFNNETGRALSFSYIKKDVGV